MVREGRKGLTAFWCGKGGLELGRSLCQVMGAFLGGCGLTANVEAVQECQDAQGAQPMVAVGARIIKQRKGFLHAVSANLRGNGPPFL